MSTVLSHKWSRGVPQLSIPYTDLYPRVLEVLPPYSVVNLLNQSPVGDSVLGYMLPGDPEVLPGMTIECFQPNAVSAAVILGGQLLCIRRGNPPYEGAISLPGGKIEKCDDSVVHRWCNDMSSDSYAGVVLTAYPRIYRTIITGFFAAIREIEEETGFQISDQLIADTGSIFQLDGPRFGYFYRNTSVPINLLILVMFLRDNHLGRVDIVAGDDAASAAWLPVEALYEYREGEHITPALFELLPYLRYII